jgi:hypothetical protein
MSVYYWIQQVKLYMKEIPACEGDPSLFIWRLLRLPAIDLLFEVGL